MGVVSLVPAVRHHRSNTLNRLLNETAQEAYRTHGFWVTALVVLSGRSYSGEGFSKAVPSKQWRPMGKTRFCRNHQKLARDWLLAQPERQR
jgi:hypothetical protein